MITFIKENLSLIVKLILNQFGTTFFGLMLALATASSPRLMLVTGVFSVAFYMFLLYTLLWEEGAKYKIRVDGGRAPYCPFNGLYLTLIANIPNILLAICVLVGYIFGRTDGAFAMEWAGNLYAVTKVIASLWQAMYLGLIQMYMPNNPLSYLLIIVPALMVGWFSYYMGMRNFRFFSWLGIKPKTKRK